MKGGLNGLARKNGQNLIISGMQSVNVLMRSPGRRYVITVQGPETTIEAPGQVLFSIPAS